MPAGDEKAGIQSCETGCVKEKATFREFAERKARR